MRILYIDIDSLRPDPLGCYGYRRNSGPNIDALAARGVRIDKLYASDSPCLPSRTAFFGGGFGTHTGVVNHGGICADVQPEGQVLTAWFAEKAGLCPLGDPFDVVRAEGGPYHARLRGPEWEP